MNPVFWLIVIIVMMALWFFGSFVFYPLGLYLYRIWKDAMNNMKKDNKEEEDIK